MRIFKFIFPFLFVILLTNCGGSFILIGEERSAGRIVDDVALWSGIKKDLVLGKKDFRGIDVAVHEARVLLTGILYDYVIKEEVSEIAWSREGVKEVINEIQIVDVDFVQHSIRDALITTQISSWLLLLKGVASGNYKITTVDGIVYLIGVARNSNELNRVIDVVGRVSGVKRIVSYIRLRDSGLRK